MAAVQPAFGAVRRRFEARPAQRRSMRMNEPSGLARTTISSKSLTDEQAPRRSERNGYIDTRHRAAFPSSPAADSRFWSFSAFCKSFTVNPKLASRSGINPDLHAVIPAADIRHAPDARNTPQHVEDIDRRVITQVDLIEFRVVRGQAQSSAIGWGPVSRPKYRSGAPRPEGVPRPVLHGSAPRRPPDRRRCSHQTSP